MAADKHTDWIGATVGCVMFVSMLIMGGAFAIDRFQATFMPEQHAAAEARRQADRDDTDAKDQVLEDQTAKAQAGKQQAEQELMAASIDLYAIRAAVPATPEAAEGMRRREAAAVARWEAAQLAVNGPTWRQHQADLEADAAYTAERKLKVRR